ncbi:MAG TPA: ABC transporter permease subunit [Nitrososphaerales archaeon]|nr:ABC transporter permease subunit [Nitrososphaerales archaeon]
MNLAKSWIVAAKDLRSFVRKRTVLYTVVVLPLMLSVLFPLVIEVSKRKANGIPAAGLPHLLDSFAFFFVIIPAIVPTPIASYSIVGEKIEKSLEPLLATPTTDGEILLGKFLAAFIPAMVATYVGATIYMTLMDSVTNGTLHYLYYPNPGFALILLVLAPISATISIEVSVIASARVNDVRSASQLGGVMYIPFLGIYLAGEIGLFPLDANNLLIVAGVLAVVALALFRVSTATFRREEILTKWK